jgi:hypothetical protein
MQYKTDIEIARETPIQHRGDSRRGKPDGGLRLAPHQAQGKEA